MGRAVRILGRGQHTDKVLVAESCNAGGIYSIKAVIGQIRDLGGRAEKSDRHIEIIDIEIIERAPAGRRVKSGRDISPQITVIAARILAVVGLYHADAADPGQELPHFFHDPAVAGRHRLKNKQPPAFCQIRKLLRMRGKGHKRLFHDDIPAGQKRLFPILIVNKVNIGYIYSVDLRIPQKLVIVRIHLFNAELLRKRLPFLHTPRPGKDRPEGYLRHLGHGRQRFPDNKTCADDSNFHNLLSSRSAVVSESGGRF